MLRGIRLRVRADQFSFRHPAARPHAARMNFLRGALALCGGDFEPRFTGTFIERRRGADLPVCKARPFISPRHHGTASDR